MLLYIIVEYITLFCQNEFQDTRYLQVPVSQPAGLRNPTHQTWSLGSPIACFTALYALDIEYFFHTQLMLSHETLVSIRALWPLPPTSRQARRSRQLFCRRHRSNTTMKIDVQVPDRGTMIRELEQRKLRNTQASVAFGSAKVGKCVIFLESWLCRCGT